MNRAFRDTSLFCTPLSSTRHGIRKQTKETFLRWDKIRERTRRRNTRSWSVQTRNEGENVLISPFALCNTKPKLHEPVNNFRFLSTNSAVCSGSSLNSSSYSDQWPPTHRRNFWLTEHVFIRTLTKITCFLTHSLTGDTKKQVRLLLRQFSHWSATTHFGRGSSTTWRRVKQILETDAINIRKYNVIQFLSVCDCRKIHKTRRFWVWLQTGRGRQRLCHIFSRSSSRRVRWGWLFDLIRVFVAAGWLVGGVVGSSEVIIRYHCQDMARHYFYSSVSCHHRRTFICLYLWGLECLQSTPPSCMLTRWLGSKAANERTIDRAFPYKNTSDTLVHILNLRL